MTLPATVNEIILKYPALSEGEAKFAHWLNANLPDLTHLWDWNEGGIQWDLVDHYLGRASHGQAIMCRFAVGIWRWKNERDFDLFEAGQVLDSHNMAIISEWAKRPWFVG